LLLGLLGPASVGSYANYQQQNPKFEEQSIQAGTVHPSGHEEHLQGA